MLPVLVHETRTETVDLSIKSSILWKYFEVHRLNKNMRTFSDEIEFFQFLIDLGDGILNDECDCVKLNSKYVADDNSDIVKDTF